MPVEIHDEQTHHVRSWYGVTAEIAVENNLWHLVRVGGVALPHPPLVNLVLRRGLPRQERLYLSFLHEFGHVQTLPVAGLHLLWLLKNGRWRGRGRWKTLAMLAAAAVTHEAMWELASEIYVIGQTGPDYGRIYRRYPNPIGQMTFWSSMVAAAVFLTCWLVQSRPVRGERIGSRDERF